MLKSRFFLGPIAALALTGCSSDPSASRGPDGEGPPPLSVPLGTGADALPGGRDLVVPLYALIPDGPDSARLLWVPWGVDGIVYSIERRAGDGWEALPADVQSDHARVTGLAPGDALRVVAHHQVVRVGQSVSLGFTPVTAPPTEVLGRAFHDGRGRGWTSTADEVRGEGRIPSIGDLLVLPINLDTRQGDVREVLSVASTLGGWRAGTAPFAAPTTPAIGSRGAVNDPTVRSAASLNLSRDGMPRDLLIPTSNGRMGYCSSSGWGCVSFAASDLIVGPDPENSTQRAATDWYPIGFTLWSLNPPLAGDGLIFEASAEIGVALQLEWETSGWLGQNVEEVAARAAPYAHGEVSGTLTAAEPGIVLERPVYSSAEIFVASAWGASVYADLDLNWVVDLDADGPVTGSWVAEIGYQRTFEVGYRDGFYGPQVVDSTPTLQVTPEFGDGSRADLWAGMRADANLNLYILGGHAVTASLQPSVGMVFSHDSTPAAPCNRTVSIAHAEVALGAKLEAELDLPFSFLDRTFLLADRRAPIATWGIRRELAVEPRFSSTSPNAFRLRPRPAPPPFTTALLQLEGDVDLANPSNLDVRIDGAPAGAALAVVAGRYQLTTSPLPLGEHTLSVWMPDQDYTGTSIFGAPGQCASSSILVEAN